MKKIRVGDACEILNGYAFKSEKYVASGIRVIRIANVQKGYIEDTDPAFYPENYLGIDRYMLKDGDILMSLTGNVGRVAILQKEMLPAALNQRLACLRVKNSELSKGYLFHFLNSDYFENKCVHASKGVAQKNMSTEWLKEYEIPLYPKEKQTEIENILDKLSLIVIHRKKELNQLDTLIKARFVEMFCNKGYPVLGWNEVFNTTTGKLDSNAMVENGDYPFFTCAKEVFRIDKYAFEQEALILSGNNAAGKYDVKYYKGKFNAYQRTYILSLKQDWSYRLFQYQLEDKLVYLQQQSLGGLTKYLTLKILGDLSFIIPPIDQQTYFEKFVEQVNKSKLLVASQPQIHIYKTLTLL